ncbi:TPA: glycosyltransferase family 2 protein, partial [Escherichia coli]|nr:glycosyltransferase family 2 protein [Escherichia coli]
MKACLIIPTYNGGEVWKKSANNIALYSKIQPHDVYVIDSESEDDTVQVAKAHGFNVKIIEGASFNHGGTRNQAITDNGVVYDVAILITQDAIPLDGFVNKILSAFEDPLVACAYGRQLPHENANSIAQHARFFNYPAKSVVNTKENIPEYGIKTAFTSNSFCAYRVSIFNLLGGFPDNTILSEDMYYAAKAINAGYKVAYVSEAQVMHSHNYSPIEEFKRYFDIGVFHATEYWIKKDFGGAGVEGKKFIISEIKYLLHKNLTLIPKACINNFMKILGYKLGQNYKIL